MSYAVAQRIHADLYTHFKWTDDKDTFGVPEYWSRPTERGGFYYGDCDDFAMEMNQRLSNVLPIAARRFGVCRVNKEARAYDHCVLLLLIEGKLYVSECNSPAIMRPSQLDYDLWYWSPPGHSLTDPWEKVEGLR